LQDAHGASKSNKNTLTDLMAERVSVLVDVKKKVVEENPFDNMDTTN
jgi:hypothetical protein